MQFTSGSVNVNQQDIRKASNWICPNQITAGSFSTGVLVADRFIWSPLIVGSNDLIVSHLAINVSVAAGAGKKARLAIYSNAHGRVFEPDRLLYDFGEVAIDKTGLASIGSDTVFGEYVILQHNTLYWVAVALEEAATLYYKPTNTLIPLCVPLASLNATMTSWRASGAYASGFPADATSVSSLSDDAGYTLVGVL